MGIKNASTTLHSITNLTLANVGHKCRRLAEMKGISPRIVADCSNLIYIFKGSYIPVVQSLVNHFSKFITAGVIVVPVCDGLVRPTAKQATNVQIAQQEKTRIAALQLQSKIWEIKNKLAGNNNEEIKKNVLLCVALEKELLSAEKRVKRKETQSKDIIPPNFNVALVDKLHSHKAHTINGESAGIYVDQVVVAEFQADSCMTGMLLNNDAIMSMTKDTDIPILAGDCCMVINEFTKNKDQIISTSESTLTFAMSLLQPTSVANFKPAIKSIFDGIQNPRLHALMMVILGCDVYVSGIVGVVVATLSKMIDVKKQELGTAFTEELLLDWLHHQLMDKNQLSYELVETYINAILCKPSNRACVTKDNGNHPVVFGRSYLFGAPLSLPKYLKELSVNDDFIAKNIVNGPNISVCKCV